jgi:hypothetical protein
MVFVSCCAGCNRNYTGVQGRIYIQSEPAHCTLMIEAQVNFTIALYFLQFYRPQSEQCLESSVEVGTVLTWHHKHVVLYVISL